MLIPAQEAFDALSDSTRREILQLLATQDEMSAGDIADHIGGVGRTAVSSHLRILRKSGLINERREGRFRYLSLDSDGPVRDAMQFLQDILGAAIPDAESQAVASQGDTRTDGVDPNDYQRSA